MDTILKYCVDNVDSMINFSQKPFSWNRYKKQHFLEIQDFACCIKSIKNEISRNDIISAFKAKDFYKGYILAMMWGGIGTQPSIKGNNKTSSAFKAFSIPKVEVERRLNILFDCLKENNIEEAYLLLEGELKFDGIDVSFFTKILSFLSESLPVSKNLLIYDKWTKLIHVHLLFDNNENPQTYFSNNRLKKLFFKNKQGKFITELINPFSSKKLPAYLNYCKMFDKLTIDVSNVLKIQITSFELESYLFGNELKGKKNKTFQNPRFWIQQNYSEKYLSNLS